MAQIELYTGYVAVAWKQVEGQWPDMENSLLLRIPAVASRALQLRARAALASSGGGRDAAKLRLAEKMAKTIEKVEMSWSEPFATLIRATIWHQRGETSNALTLLSEAIQSFEKAQMHLHAAAARRRLGEKLRDERGSQLVAQANAWMSGQKIKNPEAMTRMLAPGF